LCKYGGNSCSDYGSRGGIPYEAEVYLHVLQPLRLSTARFYGSYKDVISGETWLVVEYLDESLRVSSDSYPGAVCMAIRWLGGFHAANEALLLNSSIAFLKKYDYEYYIGWAHRTLLLASDLNLKFSWLEPLCKRWGEIVKEFFLPPSTVIHGEFYTENVLIRNRIVYPIDWESAAIAVGEIDLASITWCWPDEIVRQWEMEYQKGRWPEGTPANFQGRLDAARLFQQFRWMGTRKWISDRLKETNSSWWFEQLFIMGERLGLI